MNHQTTLYFLRSSEQYIVNKMLSYAYRLEEMHEDPAKVEALKIFTEFYGFTNKDLGLYLMSDNEVAGAIWSRKLNNGKIPTISLAVLPQHRRKGYATLMLEQFLLEAAALYDALDVELIEESFVQEIYKKVGFTQLDYEGKSLVDGKKTIKLRRQLERAEPTRPSDGYDPRRWMD